MFDFNAMIQRASLGREVEKDGRTYSVVHMINAQLALAIEKKEGAVEPHPVFLISVSKEGEGTSG